MKRVGIKMCGITNVPDAEDCARAGADMMGLNFYSESPRFVALNRARQIVEAVADEVEVVAVFVDPNASEVRRVAEAVGIRSVQLHGNVTSDTCRDLSREFRVIRALQTGCDYKPKMVREFSDCDVLLDAFDARLYGGTGARCDWRAARETRPLVRFLLLAGGLNAENVSAAIAAVNPNAVDVCSGIEKSPGVKDHDAIARFVAAVHNAFPVTSP